MRAARATVHGKANPGVPRELPCFDSANCRFDELAKFLLLALADRRGEVLNLRQMFSDEDDQSHLANTADPGVADQLRI